jgi:hypothetical protein
VTGWPKIVLVRGTVVVEDDELVAEPGHGRFVKRALFGKELAAKRHGVAKVAGGPMCYN